MNKANRRSFLRQIGLTVGALTFGVDRSTAFLYQKTTTLRRGSGLRAPETVDFRYAPDEWYSPISLPGEGGHSFIGRAGSLLRNSPGGGVESIALHVDGAGEITALTQRCEEPHNSMLRTSVSYTAATVEMSAFSSVHDDEGPVDNITVAVTPAGQPLTLRLVIRAGGTLRTEIREDDDLHWGNVCFVERDGVPDHPLLILDAEPSVAREGDALVLTLNVAPGGDSGPAVYQLRVPRGEGDTDDIVSGTRKLPARAEKEIERWNAWKSLRGPAGWDLPGTYGQFSVAAARVLDQMTPALAGSSVGNPVPAALPDLVDQHCISEAELYLGRVREAKSRLESVWNLEDDRGLLIGAGGEANMKEMSAAVYSLCRQAELTGDWALFNELYPEAFNALNSLRLKRDKASALSEPTANARRALLPEGSPGIGWSGLYEELTNTLWTLIALKPLLEISDRHFLPKKSEIREFYGQLRIAFNQSARDTQRQDPAGFSWFPMVTAPAGASAVEQTTSRPQAALGTLALGVFPGVLFKKDDRVIQDFPRLVHASLLEEIPSGTGPGPGGTFDPVDAALAAQALVWFGLPEEARSIFIGFLNHAAPVYTWRPPSWREAAPGSGGAPVDLRAQAESVRYLRHAMVMEDEDVLRLFDGIALGDLADARLLKLERTPTRWGLVSVTLEPVDARTWKVSFLREPVNPEKAPPLRSVEIPRVLPPNFRFDTITPVSAIKNGPRVIIDGAAMRWEAFLRDLRR